MPFSQVLTEASSSITRTLGLISSGIGFFHGDKVQKDTIVHLWLSSILTQRNVNWGGNWDGPTYMDREYSSSVGGGHELGRSTPRSSQPGLQCSRHWPTTPSQNAPSGWWKRRVFRRPCHRQSTAWRDRGPDGQRRSHFHMAMPARRDITCTTAPEVGSSMPSPISFCKTRTHAQQSDADRGVPNILIFGRRVNAWFGS